MKKIFLLAATIMLSIFAIGALILTFTNNVSFVAVFIILIVLDILCVRKIVKYKKASNKRLKNIFSQQQRQYNNPTDNAQNKYNPQSVAAPNKQNTPSAVTKNQNIAQSNAVSNQYIPAAILANNFELQQLQNDLRIMNDSYSIISETKNRDTLNMRFDLCNKKANEILCAVANGALTGSDAENMRNYCYNIIAESSSIKAEFDSSLQAIKISEDENFNPSNYFYISSSSFSDKDYSFFNSDECKFLYAFYNSLLQAKLKPHCVRLERHSNGELTVDYDDSTNGCWVGRINLRAITVPDKYAVKKDGNKKASRVFETQQEALSFIGTKQEYTIELREGYTGSFYMQYLVGMSNDNCVSTNNVQDCIDTIPRWIKYINYCKRH